MRSPISPSFVRNSCSSLCVSNTPKWQLQNERKTPFGSALECKPNLRQYTEEQWTALAEIGMYMKVSPCTKSSTPSEVRKYSNSPSWCASVAIDLIPEEANPSPPSKFQVHTQKTVCLQTAILHSLVQTRSIGSWLSAERDTTRKHQTKRFLRSHQTPHTLG